MVKAGFQTLNKNYNTYYMYRPIIQLIKFCICFACWSSKCGN